MFVVTNPLHQMDLFKKAFLCWSIDTVLKSMSLSSVLRRDKATLISAFDVGDLVAWRKKQL